MARIEQQGREGMAGAARRTIQSSAHERPGDPTRAFGAMPYAIREVLKGEHAIAVGSRTRMTATLGSCIAVMLNDPCRAVGGLTHIFRCVEPGPFGGAAVMAEIETLINAFMSRGYARHDLIARVTGGARMLGRGKDHGRAIAEVCLDYLRAERIEIVHVDTGGTSARRITFDPGTGALVTAYPMGPVVRKTPCPKPTVRSEFFL